MTKPNQPEGNQGEGNHEAARRYDKAQAEFAKSGKVEAAAKAAEDALDGPEGEALEAARAATARGEPAKTPR
jgi:hypothetical protein